MQPEGWPGHIWLEGRTSIHLKDHQTRPSHMPRGPAAKTGEGFLNPADIYQIASDADNHVNGPIRIGQALR